MSYLQHQKGGNIKQLVKLHKRPSRDARLKIVNNFKRSFDKILLKGGIKTGTFHDIRRIVISMWFANGMNEYEVMRLAEHSNFATTHKFYLAVAADLVDHARVTTDQGLHQKMVRFDTPPFEAKKG